MVVLDTANELKLDMDRVPVKNFVNERFHVDDFTYQAISSYTPFNYKGKKE
jgi:hypothetical protein